MYNIITILSKINYNLKIILTTHHSFLFQNIPPLLRIITLDWELKLEPTLILELADF